MTFLFISSLSITGAALLLFSSDLGNTPPVPSALIAAPSDPIAAAASGLIAQIEDDVNGGEDTMLVSITTTDCQSVLVSTARQWTIDWRNAQMVAPGDSFVFIDVPPVKLAIVGDASKPDQAAKLNALFTAMSDIGMRCRVTK